VANTTANSKKPGLLSESEGYGLLKSADLSGPGFSVVTTATEVKNSVITIGYPVVMKVISQQVEHKSDAGGVIINISSPAETTAALEKISRDVKDPHPRVRD